MNYFNQFYDTLSTFHFGVVKYDDKYYCVVRDPLIDVPFSNENKLLKRNAVRELVGLNNDRALFELNRLKAIFADLVNYKIGTKDFKEAFGRFIALSNHHSIVIKFGDSNGPINENWPLGLYSIVGNLRKDLDDELWVRERMIQDLMDSYDKAINMVIPGAAGLFESNKWERIGISNLKQDDEIDWMTWLEINKADVSWSNQLAPVIKGADMIDTKTETEVENNNNGEIKSFEKDFLNEKGRRIYPALLDKYKNKNHTPAIIGAMLIALWEHKCLNFDPTLYSPKRVLVEAITDTFGKNHNRKKYSVSSFDKPLTGDDPKDHRLYHKRIIGEMLENL